MTSPIAGGLFPISKLDIHTILLFILTFLYFYIFYNEIFPSLVGIFVSGIKPLLADIPLLDLIPYMRVCICFLCYIFKKPDIFIDYLR